MKNCKCILWHLLETQVVNLNHRSLFVIRYDGWMDAAVRSTWSLIRSLTGPFIITRHVKVRSCCQLLHTRHMSMHPELVYMTCFGIAPVAVPASGIKWGNIAGGRLVHTIISQSTHYGSISHILYTSKTCHLMLSASLWTPQRLNPTPLWHGAPR